MRAFYEHWRALRGSVLMPGSDIFLDTMPAAFVGALYISDITPEVSIVRFQGAGLEKRWGVNYTGREMSTGQPASLRAALHRIDRAVADHPCGYFARTRYVTTDQRPVEVCILRLPLAVLPGRPPRTVNFTVQDEVLGDKEYASGSLQTLRNAWIDIGAGVPDAAPEMLRQ
ncbi:MAG: hypothetical protein K2P94_07100 [Rhodospirillaceae bacterium]|nr:hypothetical protein [Rhodospirillaceae bacterium]